MMSNIGYSEFSIILWLSIVMSIDVHGDTDIVLRNFLHPLLERIGCARNAYEIMCIALDAPRTEAGLELASERGFIDRSGGVSAKRLLDALISSGLDVVALKADLEDIQTMSNPIIFHFMINGAGHFSVGRYDSEQNGVVLYDPSFSIGAHILSVEKFSDLWTGYIICSRS